VKSVRLNEKPVRLGALLVRLDAPTVRLSPLPVRLNDLTARLEAPAVWISESAVRLEAMTGAAKGASHAAKRVSRAVERISRAAGTFSRADKRVRELAGNEIWAAEGVFTGAHIMRETRETCKYAERRMPLTSPRTFRT
jgi:hypothetical protein